MEGLNREQIAERVLAGKDNEKLAGSIYLEVGTDGFVEAFWTDDLDMIDIMGALAIANNIASDQLQEG